MKRRGFLKAIAALLPAVAVVKSVEVAAPEPEPVEPLSPVREQWSGDIWCEQAESAWDDDDGHVTSYYAKKPGDEKWRRYWMAVNTKTGETQSGSEEL